MGGNDNMKQKIQVIINEILQWISPKYVQEISEEEIWKQYKEGGLI